MANARAIEAGRAQIKVSLTTSAVEKGLRRLSKTIGRIGQSFQRLGAAASAAGGVITGVFSAAVAQFTKVGDQLDKMAARTEFSVEALSGLKFAADQTGTSIESLSQALFRMRRRIANATTDTGPAARALRELGISAQLLNSLNPEQQFLRVVDALGKMADQNRAAQLGFELFGDNFRDILPLLKQGSGGIQQLQKRAADLGLTFTDDTTTAAAGLNDALSTLRMQINALFVRIGEAVASDLAKFLGKAHLVLASLIEWATHNKAVVASIAKVGVVLAGAGGLIAAVGALGLAVAGVVAVIASLATPLGAAIALFGGLALVIADQLGLFDDLAAEIGDFIGDIKLQMASLEAVIDRNVAKFSGFGEAAADASRAAGEAVIDTARALADITALAAGQPGKAGSPFGRKGVASVDSLLGAFPGDALGAGDPIIERAKNDFADAAFGALLDSVGRMFFPGRAVSAASEVRDPGRMSSLSLFDTRRAGQIFGFAGGVQEQQLEENRKQTGLLTDIRDGKAVSQAS